MGLSMGRVTEGVNMCSLDPIQMSDSVGTVQ